MSSLSEDEKIAAAIISKNLLTSKTKVDGLLVIISLIDLLIIIIIFIVFVNIELKTNMKS